VLAVTGGKGGTGKTTTTLGLAAAFARQRRRPTVVDADRDMPNLDIVADAASVTGVDVVANPDGRPLPEILPPASRDPLLVDCPAGGGPDAVTPLRHATRVLLVTTYDREAIEDAIKTAAMARAIGADVAGVVVNRCEERPASLEETFDAPVLAAIPDVPAPLADPAATAAYDRLASELDAETRLHE